MDRPPRSLLPLPLRIGALVVAVGVGSWLIVASQREAQSPPRSPAQPAIVPAPEVPVDPAGVAGTAAPEPASAAVVERAGSEAESPTPPRPMEVGAPPEPVLFHSSKAFVPKAPAPDAGSAPAGNDVPGPIFLPTSKAADPAVFEALMKPDAPDAGPAPNPIFIPTSKAADPAIFERLVPKAEPDASP